MAVSFRRILLSYRKISLSPRATSIPSRHHTFSSELSFTSTPPSRSSFPISTPITLFQQSLRGFAKGKKQNYEDEGSSVEEVNIGPSVKATTVAQMEAAIEALSRELSKLRTGRASAGMLDHIIVETSGVKMPLNGVAAVSVLDPKTLSVTPYDPNALKELEKAIVSSPLGINPKLDGERLIATIPPLTQEHVQAVCKLVAKSSEDVKQSIRRARQKALDTVKKATPKKNSKDKGNSSFSADDARRLEKEIDEWTKKFIKSAEDICKSKEKEISGS